MFEWLHVGSSEVMMVVNPQSCSLAIKSCTVRWLSAVYLSVLPLPVKIVDFSHKVSTSLAMQIIFGPFDPLGFCTDEGKILGRKPLSDRTSGLRASSYD